MTQTVRILQLYPEHLGVTGDSGNVAVLRDRLSRSGVAVEVQHHLVGGELPTQADLIVIGNGPFSALERIHADAQTNAARIAALAAESPVFAVGAGLELLGTEIRTPDSVLPGLGVVDVIAHRDRSRRVGYVVAESAAGPLVAFEDQATVLESPLPPFATVIQDADGEVSRPDGVQSATVFGTLLQGPLLPLNPALADLLASRAAEHAGLVYRPAAELAELDRLAAQATATMRANIAKHFSTIR